MLSPSMNSMNQCLLNQLMVRNGALPTIHESVIDNTVDNSIAIHDRKRKGSMISIIRSEVPERYSRIFDYHDVTDTTIIVTNFKFVKPYIENLNLSESAKNAIILTTLILMIISVCFKVAYKLVHYISDSHYNTFKRCVMFGYVITMFIQLFIMTCYT